MRSSSLLGILVGVSRRLAVAAGAAGLTLVFFLVLPMIQAISGRNDADLSLQTVDAAVLPPPPPPPMEEEPEEEEPEDEPPPQLENDAPPLDLSQLELALNPGLGSSWLGGDFAVDLSKTIAAGSDVDALFSLSDLDQKPRVVYQPGPTLTAKLRKKAPGTVYVLFVVDPNGRVKDPVVQSASDPIFERPALAAVKQWRFEPGKRKGEAVSFRMRVPITFPQG